MIRHVKVPKTIIGNCWPDYNQKLLLRAALLQGRDAVEAWEKWIAGVDVENLDSGSYRLLPLLYRNLQACGVTAPEMTTFKGIYRHTWVKNKLLIKAVNDALKCLQEVDIPVIVLQEGALLGLYYASYGLRPTYYIDLLIRPQHATQILDRLHQSGWQPQGYHSDLDAVTGITLSNPDGQRIYLRWRLFDSAEFNENIWVHAQTQKVFGKTVRVLDPADQLLQMFVQSVQWHDIPPFRWAADAMIMLKKTRPFLNWNRLSAQAQACQKILTIRAALSLLEDLLAAPVPRSVLISMQQVPVSKLEKQEYRLLTCNPKPYGALNRFRNLRIHYLRASGHQSVLFHFIDFLGFLRSRWRLEKHQNVTWIALRKILRLLISQ